MLCIAVSAIEKAHQVPAGFWIKVILGIIAFILAVFAIQKLAQVNKMVLAVVFFAIVAIVGFQWIYERNEPKFLSPYIDPIAQFFPSKGAYVVSQQQDVLKPGEKKKPAPTASPKR